MTIVFVGMFAAVALLDGLAVVAWGTAPPAAIPEAVLQLPVAVGAALGLDRVMARRSDVPDNGDSAEA